MYKLYILYILSLRHHACQTIVKFFFLVFLHYTLVYSFDHHNISTVSIIRTVVFSNCQRPWTDPRRRSGCVSVRSTSAPCSSAHCCLPWWMETGWSTRWRIWRRRVTCRCRIWRSATGGQSSVRLPPAMECFHRWKSARNAGNWRLSFQRSWPWCPARRSWSESSMVWIWRRIGLGRLGRIWVRRRTRGWFCVGWRRVVNGECPVSDRTDRGLLLWRPPLRSLRAARCPGLAARWGPILRDSGLRLIRD